MKSKPPMPCECGRERYRIEPLVTLAELCEILRVQPSTVKKNRSRGTNELYMKGFVISGTAGGLRWFRSDVREHLDSLRRRRDQ